MQRFLGAGNGKPSTQLPPNASNNEKPKVDQTHAPGGRPDEPPATTCSDDDDDYLDDEAEEAAILEEERLMALAVVEAERRASQASLPPRPVLESRLSASLENPEAYVTDKGLVLGESASRTQMTAAAGKGKPQLRMGARGVSNSALSAEAKVELEAELSRRMSSGLVIPQNLEHATMSPGRVVGGQGEPQPPAAPREDPEPIEGASEELSAEELAAADAAFASFYAEAEAEEAAEREASAALKVHRA